MASWRDESETPREFWETRLGKGVSHLVERLRQTPRGEKIVRAIEVWSKSGMPTLNETVIVERPSLRSQKKVS